MHEFDTTAGWRAQYDDLQFQVPSEADNEAKSSLWDPSICLVPRYKRKAGRPSLKRQLSFLEKKKKKVTCTRCFRRGHTKRSKLCPMFS